MELLPVEESACYRWHRPRIEETEPFRLLRDAVTVAELHTTLLYEEGPHCQWHDSLVVTSSLTSVTVRRIVGGIEQRSSLYGLLREGQGHVGGCSGGPIP